MRHGVCWLILARFQLQPMVACAILLLLHGPAKAAAVNTEFEVFGVHDNNPSRARAEDNVGAENIQGARLTFLRSMLLDERSGIVFQGGGVVERHSTFSGLNNIALNARLRYRIQPTVGYTLPWYEMFIDLERRQYADSAIRDGTSAAIELSAGKQFTDRIYSTAGFGLKRSVADHDYLFDLTQRKLFITLGYRFGAQNILYASLSKTRGDQVFGASESHGVSGAVKASADDPVFGEGYYAYRMDTASTIAEAGVNLPVRGRGSLDISAKRYRAYAYGGPAYEYTLAQIGWRYSFY